MVTVTSASPIAPTVFPLAQCGGSGVMMTLGCIATGFTPPSITFKWKDSAKNALTDFIEYPPVQSNSKYIGVSQIQVKRTEWEKEGFQCAVEHSSSVEDVTVNVQKPGPLTLTLNPPTVKEMTVNNRAVLECVVTAIDRKTLSEAKITWKLDQQTKTDGISETNITSNGTKHSKVSTLTMNLEDYYKKNTVQCVADQRGNISSAELYIKKTVEAPSILAYIPADTEDEVTLVCLVVTASECDVYIMWKENNTDKDGITSQPTKTTDGKYLVTSFYKPNKMNWDSSMKYSCTVVYGETENGTAFREISMSKVSEAFEAENDFDLNCNETDDENDELSSLWSTTSSFLILFLLSLTYSAVISLVKVKP